MVQLSESQLATIRDHPIGDALDSFRAAFESAPPRTSLRGGLDYFQQLVAQPARKTLMLQLINTFQIHPAALDLLSDDQKAPLLSDLAMLYVRLSTNKTDVKHTAQLVKHVVLGEDDPTIWTTVYDLIRKTQPPTFSLPRAPTSTARPITPQHTPSATPSFQQTPTVSKTSSLVSTTETRTEVDPLLKFEVEQNLIVDHPGVFDAFFGRVTQLSNIAAAVFDACKEPATSMYIDGVGWTDWPPDCNQDEVLGFLRHHIDQFSSFAGSRGFQPSQRRWCIATPTKPSRGSIAKRKPDFSIVCSEPADERAPCDWSHVLIPGELKTDPGEDNYRSTWLQISRYAREVFAAQDTRRFVLGFTLCGSLMRLWEFDRLGVVASKSFDIHKDGHRFVSVILGYLWMNKEELGFDPTITEDSGGRYIKIQRNNTTERVYIDRLMKRQRSIASRATTCWRGHVENKSGDQLVIKDSWEYEERLEEGQLLEEATKAGVQNVTRYYHHETVRVGGTVDDVRKNVRKGLSNEEGRNPRRQSRPTVSSAVASTVTTSSSGLGRSRGGSRDRSRSRGRGGSASRKRPSSNLDGSMLPPPPKRSCSDLTVKGDDIRRRNRVHRRVIMRDIGKSLYEASNLGAMLTGLLGGIKGLKSLSNIEILHRDISIGNVLLNEEEDDGLLIDLGLAVRTDREKASGAPSKTGTKVFMAIGALYGEDHLNVNDNESFFWLLFWICVHWNGPDQELSCSQYDSWNMKDTQELAEIKVGKILEEEKFKKEVSENFTDYCKPLITCIQQLRDVVFPGGRRRIREDLRLFTHMQTILEKAKESTSRK